MDSAAQKLFYWEGLNIGGGGGQQISSTGEYSMGVKILEFLRLVR